MHKLELRGDSDWMATRLTPRKYYPPKPSSEGSLYTSRWHPGLIEIPGVEGFWVSVGKYKSERCLLLQLAARHPFRDEVRKLAQKKLATWNATFNTWDIPILSQVAKDALAEVWDLIEVCFFELPWSHEVLELHWQYSTSESNFQVIDRRVDQLNQFWDNGSVDFYDFSTSLVFPGLSLAEIEEKSYKAFQELRPNSVWKPESEGSMHNLCVNYLRHRESAYHLLLKTEQDYLKTFRQINREIARVYPWLKDAAEKQIRIKEENVDR